MAPVVAAWPQISGPATAFIRPLAALTHPRTFYASPSKAPRRPLENVLYCAAQPFFPSLARTTSLATGNSTIGAASQQSSVDFADCCKSCQNHKHRQPANNTKTQPPRPVCTNAAFPTTTSLLRPQFRHATLLSTLLKAQPQRCFSLSAPLAMAESQTWTGLKVRQTFLEYFEQRGHTIGARGPLCCE